MRKLFFTVLLASIVSCSDDPAPPSTPATTLEPGELCDSDNRPELKLLLDPPSIVVAPNSTRPVRLTIEPDACDPTKAKFTSVNVAVAEAPQDGLFDLRHATYDFVVRGGVVGKTTISATMSSINTNGEKYDVKV